MNSASQWVQDQALPRGSFSSERYIAGMACLVKAIQELSLARELSEVQRIVRTAARELTGCDGATFVLRDDGYCKYADEDAIAPLWKGKRFPMEVCISGWTMLNKQHAIIPDIYADTRIPHAAYRPTFVKSLVMVPIRTLDPIGAIGNYWATPHHPCEEEISLLQSLADATSIAMENIRVHTELEQRVRDRTVALENALITDVLTGLHNRHGFYTLAEKALRYAQRSGKECLLAFIDVDGLKRTNDELGHNAGDELIMDIANILRETLRQSDILARVGGDEFCVLALDTPDDVVALRDRLNARITRTNQLAPKPYHLSISIGAIRTHIAGSTLLEDLISRADALMYADKREKYPAHNVPIRTAAFVPNPTLHSSAMSTHPLLL